MSRAWWIETDPGVNGIRALLVVEDEPLLRMVLAEMLRDVGFSVHIAEEGAKAIRLIETLGCELDGIVTDVRLGPGPDGWAVGRHAREQRADMPVIYVTGDSAHEWRAQGVADSELVQKPFVAAQITKAVAAAMH